MELKDVFFNLLDQIHDHIVNLSPEKTIIFLYRLESTNNIMTPTCQSFSSCLNVCLTVVVSRPEVQIRIKLGCVR